MNNHQGLKLHILIYGWHITPEQLTHKKCLVYNRMISRCMCVCWRMGCYYYYKSVSSCDLTPGPSFVFCEFVYSCQLTWAHRSPGIPSQLLVELNPASNERKLFWNILPATVKAKLKSAFCVSDVIFPQKVSNSMMRLCFAHSQKTAGTLRVSRATVSAVTSLYSE